MTPPRTMTRLAAALAVLASPAMADSQKVWNVTGANPSTLTIHAPTDPAAVATVTFENTPVHWNDDSIPLEWGGIAITVIFTWNANGTGSERIEVLPPEGYIAVPPSLDVQENSAGAVQIIEYVGG